MNLDLIDTNPKFSGFFKVWKTNKQTGESILSVDKKNTILYTGADLLAKALAGEKYSKISHFYISYCDAITTPSITAVDRTPTSFEYTDPGQDGHYGYGSVPLTIPAGFLRSTTDYVNNVVIFTIMMPSIHSIQEQIGLEFEDGCKIFEAGLVAASSSIPAAFDPVFARVKFNPVEYDSTFNLTISWGVQFIA